MKNRDSHQTQPVKTHLPALFPQGCCIIPSTYIFALEARQLTYIPITSSLIVAVPCGVHRVISSDQLLSELVTVSRIQIATMLVVVVRPARYRSANAVQVDFIVQIRRAEQMLLAPYG